MRKKEERERGEERERNKRERGVEREGNEEEVRERNKNQHHHQVSLYPTNASRITKFLSKLENLNNKILLQLFKTERTYKTKQQNKKRLHDLENENSNLLEIRRNKMKSTMRYLAKETLQKALDKGKIKNVTPLDVDE